MTSEETQESTAFSEVLRRRVFQIVGVYLGFSFATFEFTGIAVERYGLSDRLIDIALVLLVSMLPTVLMLAWFHGAPGKDRWSRVEKIGIPLNLLLAALAAGTLLSNDSVGAVAESRSATTSDGEEFVIEVAPANLVRQALVFFFDGEGPAPWTNYGVPLLLARTADRDPFVNVMTLYDTDLFWRIDRAGYPDGLGAPISLLQATAADWFQEFFVTGRLSEAEGRPSLDLAIYRTEPLQRIDQVSFAADDLYQLVEAASTFVTESIATEKEASDRVEFYPVRDVLSPDLGALEAYISARNALMIDRDLQRSISLAEQAVAQDPEFARAHLFLIRRHVEAGDFDGALAVLPDLTRLNHRLTPTQRILVKALSYELRGRPDSAIEVARTWVEIEPDNYQARNLLGNYLWNANRVDEAVLELQQSLELMPNQDWVMGQIAEYHVVRGDLAQAAETYELYHKRRPNTYLPLVALGDIATRQGNLDHAAGYFRRGNLAEPEMVTPLIRLAENAARQGDYAGAKLLLEEADLVALAPRQRASVAKLRSQLATLTGNPRAAVEHFEKELAELVENGEAFDAWIERLRKTELYVDAGRITDISSFLADIEAEFRGPLDFIPSIGYMQVALFAGDFDEAESQCQRLEEGLLALNRPDLLHMTSMTMGVIERSRGRIDTATDLLETAHDQYRSSVQQTFDASSTDSHTILIELARTQLLRGDPEAALAAVDEIRQSWPHHPEANLFAARSEAELGRFEHAEESIARALAGWAAAEPGYPLLAEAEALAATLEGAAGGS